MIIAIGDLHLSDARPWSYEVSKKIVDYIVGSEYNTPDNTLVLLGDLTESAFLSGFLYDLLLSLFIGLKYKTVVIVAGNHDKKANKQGKLVLSYKFLQNKNLNKLFPNSNIIVVDSLIEMEIEHQRCLVMPYVFSDSGYDFSYYENLPEEYHKEYDIIFGHFSDNSDMSFKEKTIDVSYLKTKYWCLGHQHNPSKNYIGSVIPNSVSEANKKRHIWSFEKTGDKLVRKYIPIPNICDYYTATFPDPLPIVDSENPIWTIVNCASEDIAKDNYGDIYILKTLYQAVMDVDELKSLGLGTTREDFSNKSLFEMWKKEAKYSPEILGLAESYL